MRYDNREVLTLEQDKLPTTLKRRQKNYIRHYDTAKFRTPTQEEKNILIGDSHIWKTGDQLYKLSLKYYGTIEDWCIIALFNNKPTEFHYKEGDEIFIPFPLYLAKQFYGIT